MDFKKKLKFRIIASAIYIIIGAAFIFAYFAAGIKNDILVSFGAMFVILGITRLIQISIFMKNPDKMRKREIEETDERNIKIWTEARTVALGIYLVLAAAAVVVLMVIGQEFAGQIVAYNILAIMVLYFICYWAVKRKY